MHTAFQHNHTSVPLSRLNALVQKRLSIKAQIKEAKKQPSLADLYLRQLKKQNLLLKDEIEAMRAERRILREGALKAA